MAYQNVGTPRFYINYAEWLTLNGWFTNPSVFNTLPVNPTLHYGGDFAVTRAASNIEHIDNAYVAILGHTIKEGNFFQIYSDDYNLTGNVYDIVNGGGGGQNIAPEYIGFTIVKVSSSGLRGIFLNGNDNIGSIMLGSYYDMPHSPDLNLSLSYEYDGVKEITTKGGNTLTNAYYKKPPRWGELGCWEIAHPSADHLNQPLSRSGRRVWDLSFSYLSDSDIFPPTSSMFNYESSEYISDSGDNPYINTLTHSDTFYSTVIHRTNGGQLPFIFQPDNSNNNPDQFAIAKLDMKSF